MLFSEPKIPQIARNRRRKRLHRQPFQCSSASRKFLKNECCDSSAGCTSSFSALQRAENSSKAVAVRAVVAAVGVSVLFSEPKIPQMTQSARSTRKQSAFQCSSASRKFLKPLVGQRCEHPSDRFSALQRAENSSNCAAVCRRDARSDVSVLFSEPKIPQTAKEDVVRTVIS